MKIVLFLLPVIVCYTVLYCEGYYPLLTNSVSFDAKFYEIRKNLHERQLNIASIGSSVTLNDLNSKIICDKSNLHYYNFASWNLEISDLDYLIRNYVITFHPKAIIICSTINDFTSKGSLKLPIAFAEINVALPYYYLKKFNSISELIKRKREFNTDFADSTDFSSLKFDKNGGVPLHIDASKYGMASRKFDVKFPNDATLVQYRSLQQLAAFMREAGLKLIFVQTPIKNSYLNSGLSKGEILKHILNCKRIIESNGGTYVSFYDSPLICDKMFADDFHLNVTGSLVFTQALVKSVQIK